MASLAPDSSSLVRVRRDFKSLPFKSSLVEKQFGQVSPSLSDSPWQQAINELGRLLDVSQVTSKRSGLPLSVVLSNHFVRYKVIPALPAFTSADKALLVATHCFRETYGDIVDDWVIKLNPVPDDDTLVACAVDSSLIAALQALVSQYQCKLKSIQPYLMSGFNLMCRHVKPQAICYAQIEAGRITIALIKDGAWQTIAGCGVAYGAGHDWADALTSLITRETLLADWPQNQFSVYLTTPDTLQDRLINKAFVENTGWKTVISEPRIVPGYSVSSDQPFSMALSAVS